MSPVGAHISGNGSIYPFVSLSCILTCTLLTGYLSVPAIILSNTVHCISITSVYKYDLHFPYRVTPLAPTLPTSRRTSTFLLPPSSTTRPTTHTPLSPNTPPTTHPRPRHTTRNNNNNKITTHHNTSPQQQTITTQCRPPPTRQPSQPAVSCLSTLRLRLRLRL